MSARKGEKKRGMRAQFGFDKKWQALKSKPTITVSRLSERRMQTTESDSSRAAARENENEKNKNTIDEVANAKRSIGGEEWLESDSDGEAGERDRDAGSLN